LNHRPYGKKQIKNSPLVYTAILLLMLADRDLGQISSNVLQFGSDTLVLTGLNVVVGLHSGFDLGLDKLVSLLDDVANISRK
jgi:hypothetical protein